MKIWREGYQIRYFETNEYSNATGARNMFQGTYEFLCLLTKIKAKEKNLNDKATPRVTSKSQPTLEPNIGTCSLAI